MRLSTTNAWASKIGFNPRTHKGCDYVHRGVRVAGSSFNPRTHKGCDTKDALTGYIHAVSIHAPIKDATDLRPYPFQAWEKFQSTHP